MTCPEHDPGIEHEPHLTGARPEPDPSEDEAGFTLFRQAERGISDRERAMHSVHDEPAHLAAHGADPRDRPEYAAWLRKGFEEAKPGRGILLALLIVIGGGPFAILGALLSGSGGLLAAVLWAPIAEEVMKVAILVTILEIRPFALPRRAWIHLAAIGSALGFAVIENLVYLNIYIPSPTIGIAFWRWTVCVALHVGCSLIASIGVVKVWQTCRAEGRPPRLPLMLPMLTAAIVIHATYNGVAMILAVTGYDF